MSFSISDLSGNPAPQNTPTQAPPATPSAIAAPSTPGSFSMSDLGSAPPPTVATANSQTPQKSAWQHFKDSALETVGPMVPQAAAPVMKSISDALDKGEQYTQEKGAEIGRLPAEGLSGIQNMGAYVPGPGPKPKMEDEAETAKREHPTISGVGEGVGKFIGSMASPENIAILAAMPEAETYPIFAKILSAGFAIQMSSGAKEQLQNLAENWDNMTPQERVEAITSSGLQFVMAAATTMHAADKLRGEPTPDSEKKPATTKTKPAATPVDERTTIRPTTKTIEGVKVPIPAIAQDNPGAVTRVASAFGDKAKAKEFQDTQTKPAAQNAVLSTVGHVAEDKIAAHNALVDGTDKPDPITGTNTPSKFQDFDDIHTATQKAAQRTYAKADDVSASDIAAWQEKVKEALAAAKQTVDQHNANVDDFNANRNTADEEPQEKIQFDPSKVSLPEKPQTYNELKSALDTAKRNAQSPDAVVRGEAIDNGIPKAQKAVDNWFRQHSDQISPEEYQSAKSLYSDSQRFGDIAQALRQPLKDGTITGNKLRQIENQMNQKAFRNGGTPDRFQRLLGPDGYQNWRDTAKLFDPVKGLPGGSWGSIAAGFLAERVFGPLGAVGVGAAKAGQWVLNRALFDPEFGTFLKDTANYLKNSHQAAIASPLFQLPKDLYARAQALVEKAKPVAKALEKTPGSVPDVAAKYNQSVGKPPIDGTKVGVDPRANDIADAYDKLKHDPNDPKVRQSYDALVKETKDQWKALQDAGYKLEVVDQDPYANYEDMAKDIRDNKEIKVFSGGQPPADHPLSQIDPETGVSNNTLFRAVHDIMGHVAGDNDFSQRGEENAYQRHAQSYSDEALPALTTETKGQTSHYFNNSRVREGGTPDFVDQRAALLPEEFHGKQPEPEPLRVNHWSSVPGITETDPEKFGTGVRGAERNRANEPGFLKRTNFGKEGYKEPAVQSKPYKYTADLDPSKYYDAAADPEGIWQKGFAEGGATGAERAVRDAGYHGYHSGTEVASFEKVPVRPADKVIEGQIANQLTQTYSSPSEGVHQVLTEGPNGTNRGYLFAKDVDGNPDAVRIASHGVEEASRGQGIGPSQIENLAWNLNRAGKTTLLSDLQMTDDAKRAWDKVQAKFPDAVTKTPSGYIFDLNKLTPGAKVKPQTLQRRYSGH